VGVICLAIGHPCYDAWNRTFTSCLPKVRCTEVNLIKLFPADFHHRLAGNTKDSPRRYQGVVDQGLHSHANTSSGHYCTVLYVCLERLRRLSGQVRTSLPVETRWLFYLVGQVVGQLLLQDKAGHTVDVLETCCATQWAPNSFFLSWPCQ
jgi:hypothetical protein